TPFVFARGKTQAARLTVFPRKISKNERHLQLARTPSGNEFAAETQGDTLERGGRAVGVKPQLQHAVGFDEEAPVNLHAVTVADEVRKPPVPLKHRPAAAGEQRA